MKFLDSLVDTIADTGKGVVKKAKDVTEVTKIAGQISVEENEIKQAYLAIGKKYYEEVQRDVPERFFKEFNRIEEAKAKISELKERQKELKGINECPSCGFEVTAEAGFCSSCGAKLEQQMQEETEEETEDGTAEVKNDIESTEPSQPAAPEENPESASICIEKPIPEETADSSDEI